MTKIKTKKTTTPTISPASELEQLRDLKNSQFRQDADGTISIRGLHQRGRTFTAHNKTKLDPEQGQRLMDFCLKHNIAASLVVTIIFDRWLIEMVDRLDAELARDEARLK